VQDEGEKAANRVIEEHLAKSTVGRKGLKLDPWRSQLKDKGEIDVDTKDVEAAALADLVIQQHTNLKRLELNLVTKAKTRAETRASLDVAKAHLQKYFTQ
jgi:hypothetical protein